MPPSVDNSYLAVLDKYPDADVSISPTIITAAERIKTIRATALSLAGVLESQLMEQLWIIDKELGRPAAFRLVAETLGLDPDYAVRCVASWDAARSNPALLKLTSQSPAEAMKLISSLASAEVPADDPRVVKLLGMPQQARNKELSKLIDQRDGISDEAGPQTNAPHPAISASRKIKDLHQAINLLAKACEALKPDIASLSLKQKTEIIAISDQSHGNIDELISPIYNVE